ncbi:MAG TPA: radical SAM protein [Bacillota bacterium]|nr:radical SAM protein [Bacillota bacterium]
MRTMIAKTLFQGPGNNYNVYRGCTHGCIYCDSRSSCYEIPPPFEDIIVKVNAPELALRELSRKRKKVMVHSGSMCDPYMPIEAELGLSRKVLEVILKTGNGAGFLTKNVLALRDLDLMEAINRQAKAVACFTLTTMDDALAKRIEPRASLPSERLKALWTFAQHGITTGVWMTPLLPFLTANEENIVSIVRSCAAVQVKYIVCFDVGTTMREGSRDYFYQKLDELFPGMKRRYQAEYGLEYICKAPDHERLYSVFTEECKKAGIAWLWPDIEELTRIPDRIEQLTLF